MNTIKSMNNPVKTQPFSILRTFAFTLLFLTLSGCAHKDPLEPMIPPGPLPGHVSVNIMTGLQNITQVEFPPLGPRTEMDLINVLILKKPDAAINALDHLMARDFNIPLRAQTRLMFAASWSISAVIEELIRRGDNFQIGDRHNITALMYAARYNRAPNIMTLLRNGAHLSAVSDTGISALMVASAFGNFDAVQILLLRGAQTNKMDHFGNTALSYAKAGHLLQLPGSYPPNHVYRIDTIRLLQSFGGVEMVK